MDKRDRSISVAAAKDSQEGRFQASNLIYANLEYNSQHKELLHLALSPQSVNMARVTVQ